MPQWNFLILCLCIPGSPPSASIFSWAMATGPWASYKQSCTPATVLPPGPSSVPGAWCLVHGSAGPMLFKLEWTDSISLSPILTIPWFVPLITASPNTAPLFSPNLCWSWLETWFWFLLSPDCYCLNLELDPEFPKLVLGQVFILFYYAHYSPCKVQSVNTELQSVKTPINHTKL